MLALLSRQMALQVKRPFRVGLIPQESRFASTGIALLILINVLDCGIMQVVFDSRLSSVVGNGE